MQQYDSRLGSTPPLQLCMRAGIGCGTQRLPATAPTQQLIHSSLLNLPWSSICGQGLQNLIRHSQAMEWLAAPNRAKVAALSHVRKGWGGVSHQPPNSTRMQSVRQTLTPNSKSPGGTRVCTHTSHRRSVTTQSPKLALWSRQSMQAMLSERAQKPLTGTGAPPRAPHSRSAQMAEWI